MRSAKIERKIEYKDIAGSEMAAVDDRRGIVTGYANRTGNVDFQDDRTLYGAWRKTLADAYARKAAQNLDYIVPYLWSHNWEQLPPGGVVDADETHDGLYIKVQMNLDIQIGREVYASFKAGTVKKQSVGYKTIACDYVKDEKTGRTIRELKELALVECSAVVFPANDLAQVTTVKNQSRRNFYMPGRTLVSPTKDFDSRYQDQQVDDWCYADWNDLTTALKQAVQDCFSGGSDPMQALESDVIPQLLSALRAYVSAGIALDASSYLSEQGSSDYGMMSAGNAGGESKSGYLSVSGHAKIKQASENIMKHARIVQSELANLESANARRRAGQLAGWPVYGSASSSDDFPTKEAEDLTAIKLSGLVTQLTVSNNMREIREMSAEMAKQSSVSAGVDQALANLLAKMGNGGNKRR